MKGVTFTSRIWLLHRLAGPTQLLWDNIAINCRSGIEEYESLASAIPLLGLKERLDKDNPLIALSVLLAETLNVKFGPA